MSVRKAIATILLACFGILLPAAASPLRVCLLERQFLIAETGTDSKCCQDCNRDADEPDPCCLDLEALPDSSAPQPSVELPPVIITDLPASAIAAPLPVECGCGVLARSPSMRGRASPAAQRAVLGIWRL